MQVNTGPTLNKRIISRIDNDPDINAVSKAGISRHISNNSLKPVFKLCVSDQASLSHMSHNDCRQEKKQEFTHQAVFHLKLLLYLSIFDIKFYIY